MPALYRLFPEQPLYALLKFESQYQYYGMSSSMIWYIFCSQGCPYERNHPNQFPRMTVPRLPMKLHPHQHVIAVKYLPHTPDKCTWLILNRVLCMHYMNEMKYQKPWNKPLFFLSTIYLHMICIYNYNANVKREYWGLRVFGCQLPHLTSRIKIQPVPAWNQQSIANIRKLFSNQFQGSPQLRRG